MKSLYDQYETMFTPHLEIMVIRYCDIKPEIKTDVIGRKKEPEEPEKDIFHVEEENKGLTVTNNVSYDIQNTVKRGIFRRK